MSRSPDGPPTVAGMDITEEPQRFEGASLVALFGAVLLLVSPFLTWFDPGGSAWTLFEVVDLVIIFVALYVGVTSVARLLAVHDGSDPRAMPIAGGVAFVVVVATMLEPPPLALDASLGFGAWLALFGATIILAAGLLELTRVSVTVSVGSRDGDAPQPPARADEPILGDRRPPTAWAPPVAPEHVETTAFPRSPAPTDAPPSRSPSLLRPNDPPRPPDQVPEGD